MNIGSTDYSHNSNGGFLMFGGELETQRINAIGAGGFIVIPDWTFANGIINIEDSGCFQHQGKMTMVDGHITMRDGQWYGDTLKLESTTLTGGGYVEIWSELDNRGKVVADGLGEDRVLDLSAVASVTGTQTGGDGFGWYAQNQGKLIYPSNFITASDGLYTWGDDAVGSIDLVNSVQMSLADVALNTEENTFSLALLASDLAEIPPGLPGQTLGVWDFLPPDMTFGSADLIFRYDDALAATIGLLESDLRVFHYDGISWVDVTTGQYADDHQIFAEGLTGFSMYAVAAIPEPTLLSFLLLGGLAVFYRRNLYVCKS